MQRLNGNATRQQTGISIISDPENFLALRDEWNSLWSRIGGHHYQSFDVCWLCWTRVAKPRGGSLHCIVYRERGELVLVWPLVRRRRSLWTILEPLASGTADHTSILASTGSEAAIEAAWQAASKGSRIDLFSIPYVSKGTRLDRLASGHGGLVVARQDTSALALLRREPDWTAYCKTLSTLSKKKPGALERRFMKEGALEIKVLDARDVSEHRKWVDWMLAQKRQWAERNGKDGPWLQSEGYRDYLVDLLDGSRGKSLALMFVMTLDNAPVCANMVGLALTCASGLIAGFDPSFAKFSPGAIMMERCVKWAWENQMDLDFGVGSEPFKAYWSRGNVLQNTSFELALSPWGRVAFLAKDCLKKLAEWKASRANGSEVQGSVQPADADMAKFPSSLPGKSVAGLTRSRMSAQ
ncbi:GNAT family N-acetyltransferase [Caballeronia sp. GAWG1-1]|uniref:GNAT family N-acetyltransferase n=1 Tax=Caballeronia sp. GAWG1-1 TaxID=2921742 RepID=UPI0020282739|nr:GNAT family N-acetyltransferase [Caballeronia sp. GAWG1-1]